MFIYNFKFNGKKMVKILLIFILLAITIYFIIATYKIYKNSFKVKDNIDEKNTIYITAENYTNILKSVYDDTDSYIGRNICFTGYIYRLIDFKDTEFVLARDMLTDSNSKSLIVGFLCDYKNAQNFADYSWVELSGTISKGYYHGNIPIIKVTSIESINKPEDDIYSYPPDDTYIPTSSIF